MISNEHLQLIQIGFGCTLFAAIAALTIVDMRHMILPNWLNLLLALAGLGHSVVLRQPSLVDAFIGAVGGGGFLAFVAMVYFRIRGIEGLGLGDSKFTAAAGTWIGWQGIPLMLSIASVSALIYMLARSISGRRFGATERLPFGPFLGLGAFCTWMMMVLRPGW
jgi:leader peptidase (prepilin peptidase)/N-methyltransferase